MIPNAPRATTDSSHVGTGADPMVVLLDDGDATFPMPREEVQWDWDAESVTATRHCQLCGAAEPLFRMDGGTLACGACCHGHAVASLPTPAADRPPAARRRRRPRAARAASTSTEAPAPVGDTARGFLEPELLPESSSAFDIERY
jgi:hypothetical protein